MKETNPSTQNGTDSHGNSSKEPPSSVPVYHVTFPGTFIEVVSNEVIAVILVIMNRWI